MKTILIILALTVQINALGYSQKRSVHEPIKTPTPSIVITPEPIAVKDKLVTYGIGSSVEKSFAQPALDLLNKVYSSGCLKEKFITKTFVSLHNIDGQQVKTRLEAYERYVSGAPYSVDLRWYTARWGSSVVGYTYNYYDSASSGKSETRIFSNTRIVGYYTPKLYAAHISHELSHQARAGGFVHWTVFDGSVPYEIGDIVEECLQ